MMKTRCMVALRPKMDRGEMMRRGMFMLIALLLVCVLMAGAVSANGPYQYLTPNSEFHIMVESREAVIESPGWYTLNENSAGTIEINADSGDVILKSAKGVKFTGNIVISGSAKVIIDGMDIIVKDRPRHSGRPVYAINILSRSPGDLVLQHSNITFNSSMNGKRGCVIHARDTIRNSKVTNNKFLNVPGDALMLSYGLMGGTSMEVRGNTVTMNPYKKMTDTDGCALLNVAGSAWPDSDTTYTVCDNVVTKVPDAQNDFLLVHTGGNKMNGLVHIKITIYNNSLGGEKNNRDRLYNGVSHDKLGALHINENITTSVLPTSVQTPAPVLGGFLGLLATGVLLRGRE